MSHYLAQLTSPKIEALLDAGGLVILLPVGSVEPHGPHMSLVTDTVISEAAAQRACDVLAERGVTAVIAPAIPYGVTECARQFPGAVSIPPDALGGYLRAVASGFATAGAAHVCVVNNHLEPAHDKAIRDAVADLDSVSVACPLTRRWARTLSDEFKSGACHAGRYETSLILAADPSLVDDEVRAELPEVPISLSDNLRNGVGDFVDMGLSQAYAGDPAAATAQEGAALLDLLAEMIAAEVTEALQ